MGRLTFSPGSRVYVDTAPIIYTTERHPDYASTLQPLWEAAKLGQIEVVTSELTLLEALVIPVRKNDEELIETYDDLFGNSQIKLIPITTSVLREATQLRAHQNFKTPDAIHAATALETSCDYLIANDTGFRRLENIEVIVLSDLL